MIELKLNRNNSKVNELSTLTNSNNTNNNNIDNKLTGLHPNYISGLTQSDGSFSCGISIVELKKGKNLRFRPKFDLCLDKDSKNVLESIQEYFGCGQISSVKKDGSVSFVVSNLKDLKNVIIPHFINYPVFFNKLHAFQLIIKILNLIKDKKALRDNVKLLRYAISMNIASKRTKEEIINFYSVLGISSEKILPNIPDNIKNITSEVTPEFLSGMVDGDGSFYVIFTENLKVIPAMKLCYGNNCEQFEPYFKKYFGEIGHIEEKANLRI
jgi:LAGLIDADG endonuclease